MTIPDLVFKNLERKENAQALAQIQEGEYRFITYRKLYKKTLRFAEGLFRLGTRGGDTVAIFSENRSEWVIADLAIQMLGAITVPIHSVFQEKYVRHILNDCGAKIAIISDNHLFEKLNHIHNGLPLHTIIYCAKNKILGLNQKKHFHFTDFTRKYSKTNPMNLRYSSSIATIIYTSGTTGMPKGAALTHENIVSNVEAIQRAIPLHMDDRLLSILPLSHVFERTAGCYAPLTSGACIFYGESSRDPRAIPHDLKRARPTVLLGVPRIFEKAHEKILANKMFHIVKYLPCGGALLSRIIKKRFGGAIRLCVSGGASLDKAIGAFFHKYGLTILEGYGLTETSPVISCNRENAHVFGSCGLPLDNLIVKIADDGEIIVKGPSVMQGYYKLPGATQAAFTLEGFFKTGDLGSIDADGFLHITGRKKNILVLSTGKNVQPEEIETALNASPFITQAIVVGDGKKMVTALIAPEREMLKAEGIAEERSAHTRIQEEINRILADFPEHERIKKITILKEPFLVERDELTPTLKLKRKVIEERYKEVIGEMYRV
ncbi:MAG: hypothetical protein A2249_01175 [Candidatus Jacksonbacteria bacterium RIFOXYA2_FULL_44_7]|uniref:AMP-dependent synthetase/ligase domain-containing protein n=1 Tax=Candidatus Jacksonbacteria bacterium RIFCSPLOWO2_02_FULL_44_20 TaxID=1798460 RepID=A0A1G2AAV7_9BACT|nr:MAG: Long-chain-fatty-acid-CoA ligase [Parcubacteria group bacterium GW2011_GWC2_44_17]OGY70069.1 MAG: hypothetical protein A3E05_00505 [Candidatus Jacksonbacteria bacterium RIFCSPHIGHO2_12_FULL_44_12]OGY71780.1 MAG: hypothetical protein A3C00_03880 [Candidatus Jacksonbacteria bacterium RIFCSPHIGHO2_02_FULL_44_25]OGY73962.1 MAG: hypothetical protein A3H61_02145 [Candidatus Jacksonbacteria bacterium RIFCSPLOWO2_02_FULL_44_20]OGY75263.1 MAG: hypothetical protein A2249_01175 [Candidatus Jackson